MLVCGCGIKFRETNVKVSLARIRARFLSASFMHPQLATTVYDSNNHQGRNLESLQTTV
jgi:hypothetical protein